MQTSPDLFTLRTLTDTVMIGPRAAFGRGHRHALQSEEALRQRLTRARIDHGAMQRLRRACERWRGGDGFVYTTDAALIARVVADTRRGRLAAWVMPNTTVRDLRQPDVERAAARIAAGAVAPRAADAPNLRAVRDQGAVRIAAHAVPAPHHPTAIGSNPAVRAPRLDVAGMTIEDRLAEILRRATRSDRLTEEMAAQLKAMIAPAEIAKTVAVLAIWAASHAVGIGFFIDLLLLGSGLLFLGRAAVEAARNLKKFVETAVAARTEAELDLAADLLAVVIVTIGIKVLQAAIRRGGTRLTSGAAARGGRFDKQGHDTPAAGPKPREKSASSDSAGSPKPKDSKWKAKDVNDRKVHQRDDLIDPNKKDDRGRTNKERMEKGLAPLGPDGKPVNLHHTTQNEPGPIAEISETMHKDNHKVLHAFPTAQSKVGYSSAPPPIDRQAFENWKRGYWKTRAKDF